MTMTPIDRFHATVARRPVDRPCTWLGIPDSGALRGLFNHFGVGGIGALIDKLNDDIVPVELPYHSPTSNAIYAAFDFAKQGPMPPEHRTLNAPGFFEGLRDPADVALFNWPDPTCCIDPAACRDAMAMAPEGRVRLGVVWSSHFQDACAAFGMEDALVAMIEAPDLVHAVTSRITDFYLRANGVFFEATRGQLHAVLIGNDLGTQTGLMLSPEMIREFVLPGTRRLVAQAKAFGLTVIHHSCGAIREIIPDLIASGVDVVHPIQALAQGMDPAGLRRDFGDRVAFCGGVDAQELLVHGTPAQVRTAVRELRALFPTGLIISPSHEAILTDTPPANIQAMFEAARE